MTDYLVITSLQSATRCQESINNRTTQVTTHYLYETQTSHKNVTIGHIPRF